MEGREKSLFTGYLCPICVVRLPYAEKLAEHWLKFHCKRPGDDLKSFPSLGYAARKLRTKKNIKKTQGSQVIPHDFRRILINYHHPVICIHCDQIIWKLASCCKECGFIYHVDCQELVSLNQCGCKMSLDAKTFGENTKNEGIGEIRSQWHTSSIHIRRSSNQKRREIVKKEKEMELNYITDQLIAMNFPDSGRENEYQTRLLQSLKSLQNKHRDKFRIINVSERRYDILQLNQPGHVLDYGWPDHLAPPLLKIDQIIKSIHCWLKADSRNVAVIHCKGGKSRLGLVIASYIQFSKNLPSPQGALDWFALKKYFDEKLEGATHPSQKRYVRYYGNLYDGRLKITNTSLLFQNIIFHGIPPFGGSSGLKFRLKIYQGYHLVYTTKSYFVPEDYERFNITFDDQVEVQGDVMIKCVQQGSCLQNVIFRLQFHSDGIDRCVATFGKYDLDDAFQDRKYPDSCFVELIFAPTCENIFISERKMASQVAPPKGESSHIPGPLNGNPYAQVDSQLRLKLLRARSLDEKQEISLQQGIEDLDGILGDLGYTSSGEADVNANSYYNKSPYSFKTPPPQRAMLKIKQAPEVNESKIQMQRTGTLHEAPTSHNIDKRQISKSFSVGSELERKPATRTMSVDSYSKVLRPGNAPTDTLAGLLHDLENSTLNSYKSPQKDKSNTSRYDNDLDEEEEESKLNKHRMEKERQDSIDGEVEIEIKPGTVAQQVKNLNKVLFKDACEYSKKYGVPLAGFNDASVVEEKITEFNSRSVAPGFCSPKADQVYHSQGGLKKVEYEKDHEDGLKQQLIYPAEENGGLSTLDDEYRSKMASLLSRSDSAYGESMRSSSPSPVITPTSSRQHVVNGNNGGEHFDLTPIDTSYPSKQSDSHSPRSDVNGKSSGIGSRSSSMTSLDCDDDTFNSNHHQQQQHSLQKQHFQQSQHVHHKDQPTRHDTMNNFQKQQQNLQQPQKERQNDDKTIFKQQPQHCSVVTFQNVSLKKSDYCSVKLDVNRNIVEVEHERQTSRNAAQKPLYAKKKDVGNSDSKSSLTIVEENIQPSQVQKEVESLNDNLFKNLLEEDYTRTPTDMPVSIPYQNNGTMYSRRSNETFHSVQSVDESSKSHQSNDFDDNQSTHGTIRRFPSHHTRQHHDGVQQQLSNGQLNGRPGPLITRTRTLSNGSSTTSDEAIGSPRSIGSSGGGSGRSTLRQRRYRNSGGSSTSSVSSGELFPDVVKYPHIKFDKDTMNLWYKPNISREEATSLLKHKEPGAFVVRDSQSYGGMFGLAVKVETPPAGVIQQAGGDISKLDLENELVRHFLIEPCKKGVRLKGSNEEPTFPSLVALVYQHSLTKMALPVPLVIPQIDVVDGTGEIDITSLTTLTETQLLEKGAACNLVYLGAVKVDTLTGDGAVQYSMNKVTSPSITLKTTVVNIKVTRNGITLTDNNRRIFFRKHFPMSDVLHCGVDPKGRKFNLKTEIDHIDREAGCFGFVVKKHANSPENHCHVFAEMELDQPASAVINFIHKAMRSIQV